MVHRYVTPASPSVQVNVEVAVLFGSGGFAVNTGAGGGTVSTVHFRNPASGDAFPAASTARTLNVC